MVMPTEVPAPTYAPLRERRRGLRERALPVLDDRHRGQDSERLTAGALFESKPPRTRRLWDRPSAFVRRLVGMGRIGRPRPPRSSGAPHTADGSAATEAVLAQRITGLGSGPYSGTPFLVVPRTTTGAGQPPALDEPCEAARHDHGIIDHSRHVSSIGRR